MIKPKRLPTFYYLDHFEEFLQYFDGPNSRLLNEKAKQFLLYFQSAPTAVKALIVRIANRKHTLVATSNLKYEEISELPEHLNTLRSDGMIASIDCAEPEDIAQALPKKDLICALKLLGCCTPLSTLKKEEVQGIFIESYSKSDAKLLHSLPYIYRAFDSELRFLLFLYFGHLRGKLNQFSMRDLGVMRTRSDAVTGEARFDDADDAAHAFRYALLRVELQKENREALADLEDLPIVSSVHAKRIKDKYLYELGRTYLSIDRAYGLKALVLSDSDEAKEKWLREKYKDGEKELVKKELLLLMESGCSENLLQFSEDFYARKFKQKRTSKLTDMLRSAHQCLKIDSRYNQQVENGVVAYYQRAGLTALKTENQLWRSLFGLVFWPILFEQEAANLGNQFERMPPVLKNNQFYEVHREAIDKILLRLDSNQKILLHISKMASLHYGKVNSIFMWRSNLLERIKLFLAHIDHDAIVAYLCVTSKNFQAYSDGYPDLLVIAEGQLHFEEIKAPGDSLRRNQLVTIQKLRDLGFDVRITQVEWFRDPEQIYSVVDIETTGGKAQHHRITEIGIIKMRGTEPIDQWHSLVNPQRHIPTSITRLTGIDNDLVKEAPIFSEIASSLDEFTRDTIFVAHNVNFDLSFIKQEFARLDLAYRRPKLCTVQQCRRVFPGLSSYSLANLTKHFDIDMDRHHRALSDAKAAADLLSLILENEVEEESDQQQ